MQSQSPSSLLSRSLARATAAAASNLKGASHPIPLLVRSPSLARSSSLRPRYNSHMQHTSHAHTPSPALRCHARRRRRQHLITLALPPSLLLSLNGQASLCLLPVCLPAVGRKETSISRCAANTRCPKAFANLVPNYQMEGVGRESEGAESCRSDAICMKTCVPFGKKRGRAGPRACWMGT